MKSTIDTISWDIAQTFHEFLSKYRYNFPDLSYEEIAQRIEHGVWIARDAWNQAEGTTLNEKADHFYSAFSSEYIYDHMLAHRDHRFTYNWCERYLFPELNSGERVLDFGGGIGWHSLHMAWNGLEAIYLDVPGEHANFARFRADQLLEHFGSPKGSITFATTDSEQKRQADQGYETVFSYAVLEHFDEDLLPVILKSMDRSLKAGGQMIHFIDPNADDTHPMHRAKAIEQTTAVLADIGYIRRQEAGVPQPGIWLKPGGKKEMKRRGRK